MFDFKKNDRQNVKKDLKGMLNRFLTSQAAEYKIRSDYIDNITEESGKLSHKYLEKMVREMINAEFDGETVSQKTVDMLTNAVVHRIKKKQLDYLDKLEDEEQR